MKTQNIEAQEYFSKKAVGYYYEHYGNINSSTFYPSLYLRHRYTLEMLDKLKSGKALDIGCGSGAMVRELIDRGYSVIAADISNEMLDATRKTVKGHPKEKNVIQYTQQDIESMDFESNSFDLIICTGVIEYLKSDEKAILEIERVLKPGGVAFISSQNKLGPNSLIDLGFLIFPKKIKNKFVTIKQHHNHIPWKLSKELKKTGLEQEDFAYHHFYPLTIPFDRLFKRFCVKVGKKMERWHKRKFGWLLATGFVLMVRKK